MMRNRFAAAAAISLLLLAIRPARAQWSEEMKAYFANLAGERLAKSPYGQALWGLCVMDLASGETLYSEGGDKLFMPASNRKLFVSAFALDVLGGEYRFRTTLEYSGAVAPDGVLNGDLVVRASGDPSISGRFRSDSSATAILREWARQTKAKGIGAVAGDLVVDASCFDPATRMGEGWSWEYESSYYAAPSGAFSFNENTVLVCVSPGSASGERCRIELVPKADCFVIDNQTSTSSSSSGTIVVERERGSNVIKVRGSMRRGAGTDYNSISVVDPSLFAGSALKAVFEREGVAIGGQVRVVYEAPKTTGEALVEHLSPPLKDILKHVNQSSNNHMAEMIYLATGRAATGMRASYARSAEAEAQFWRKMGISDAARLHSSDGSGLSRKNLFTPRAFCELLRGMRAHPERDTYLASLAVSGKSGTLQGRMSEASYRQRVMGKTGTIANVSCLSGYIIDKNNQTLVFSFLTNNFTCSSSSIRETQDALCKWLIDLPGRQTASSADSDAMGG